MDRISIYLLALAFIVGSCASPLDPDTPRKRIEESGTTQPPVSTARIYPRSVSIAVKENGTAWKCSIIDTVAMIDTAGQGRPIWFAMKLMRAAQTKQFPFLQELSLRVDSLPTDDSQRMLGGDPQAGSGALFKIATAKDSSGIIQYATVTAGGQGAVSSVSAHHDPLLRQILGQLTATLSPYQLTVDVRVTYSY